MGDPRGIGPEVMVRAMGEIAGSKRARFAIVAAREPIESAVEMFGSRRLKSIYSRANWLKQLPPDPGALTLIEAARFSFGKKTIEGPDKKAGRAARECLERALELVTSGQAHGLVTAPVDKANLLAAGFSHPGHTGWLEEMTGAKAVMMLSAGNFRVVPATTHVPLSEVPKQLSAKLILDTLTVLDAELRKRFRIERPRIAVSALNPHAGEKGAIGDEEERVIRPAIEQARGKGVDATGPYPADTMFGKSARKDYDAALLMYHDQAMIPIKALAMSRAVNVTLGLPIVRTSPAHGTAPDIAWQGKADPGSMTAAVKLAVRLAR